MDIGVLIANRYQVVQHIGRGGMADVWSATDQLFGRLVAIKTIMPGLKMEDKDPLEAFKKEADTIAKLEHPHILPVYDTGEFEGQVYIVMRYVTGGSLEDLLERGPLPMDQALKMGERIAEALQYAHTFQDPLTEEDRHIIHLDLKPANVLLDSQQRPYLADFGLATVLDAEGRAENPMAGTLQYMAPEQLTADALDHRADLYAFAVMFYHMLKGKLPFDANTALALRQLQFQENLPDLDADNQTFPPMLIDVLRTATAMNVDDRYNDVLEFMQAVQGTVEVQMAGMGAAADEGNWWDDTVEVSPRMPSVPLSGNFELDEAIDLYTRAHHAWSGGHGRFLLGVTHFMLMNGYYRRAEENGLALDDAGRQMLLRGALEYDHDLEYWWDTLDDGSRRWVCLHAIRSANAPTRTRALYRLETLPDSDPPQIHRSVAQALQVERDEDAKLAALRVLGTRAKLLSGQAEYQIESAYRGRLLTTMTRLGIQTGPPGEWREAVYSPEIDTLLAVIALDQDMPQVAESAARIIGRIRSRTAVHFVAEHQRQGTPGALRALALIRDEAPSLPNEVSSSARFYVWLDNTWRRLTHRSMELVWRYLLAVIGGWLAMGGYIFTTYRSQAIFVPQRWGNTIAIGLVFGVFTGLLVLLADEASSRLRRFWPWWGRLILFGLVGFGLGTLTWGAYTWLYLQQPPEWEMMRFAGLGLALGFVINGMFKLPGWLSVLVTAYSTYIPLLLAYLYGGYFDEFDFFLVIAQRWLVLPVAGVGLIGGFAIAKLLRLQGLLRVVFTTLVTVGTGGAYLLLVNQRPDLSLLFIVNQGPDLSLVYAREWQFIPVAILGLGIGLITSDLLRSRGWWRTLYTFIITAMLLVLYYRVIYSQPGSEFVFALQFIPFTFHLIIAWIFFTWVGLRRWWRIDAVVIPPLILLALSQPFEYVTVALQPIREVSPVAVLYLDNPEQAFSLFIPFVIVLAAGAHAKDLFHDVVGMADAVRDRVRAVLAYIIGLFRDPDKAKAKSAVPTVPAAVSGSKIDDETAATARLDRPVEEDIIHEPASLMTEWDVQFSPFQDDVPDKRREIGDMPAVPWSDVPPDDEE